MKLKGKVLIADGTPDETGDRLYMDKCSFPRGCQRCLVVMDNQKGPEHTVGSATLVKRENTLYATVTLFDVRDRRCSPMSQALYEVLKTGLLFPMPSVMGRIISRDDAGNIKEFTVDCLSLSFRAHNDDKRIGPMKIVWEKLKSPWEMMEDK